MPSSYSLIIYACGNGDFEPVEVLGHAHLAAESGGVGEAVGQVQHVHFLVGRAVRDAVEVRLLEHQVTSEIP